MCGVLDAPNTRDSIDEVIDSVIDSAKRMDSNFDPTLTPSKISVFSQPSEDKKNPEDENGNSSDDGENDQFC